MRIKIQNRSVLIDDRNSKHIIDGRSEKFVEQIVPKTFRRVLEKIDKIF